MKQSAQTLSDLPIGARLLYRAKDDWRTAVISKFGQEKATLIVCSPTGRTYRLRRDLSAKINFEGRFPILMAKVKDKWLDNFALYDTRW